MDYVRMTAPCGLPCFNCVVHLAERAPELRARVSRQFGIPEKDVRCPGCRDVEGKCPVIPMECSVYPCARKKGVTFCYECPDFPCDSLHPYADQAGSLPHNTKIFNLCLIKKMGVEAWAKEKAGTVREVYFKGKWKL
ncbi:MAG TPA: DUF3795 domain-containing protein [Thermodesulfobacteriota bacterium]|nr:DUF3795 domain-containing protein [Thermodesulfobacteriota bacterium]